MKVVESAFYLDFQGKPKATGNTYFPCVMWPSYMFHVAFIHSQKPTKNQFLSVSKCANDMIFHCEMNEMIIALYLNSWDLFNDGCCLMFILKEIMSYLDLQW